MFIPLRTNRPPRRRPVVTEALIIANLVIYLTGLVLPFAGVSQGPESLIAWGHVGRADFHAWQLITYQFLHDPGGIWHVGANMLFLWVFGCAVESRLGRLGFLGFYLIGGAVAGIAHTMVSAAPVIGASGAVAAVSGSFLALFPRARVQVLIFFFYVGVVSIPALWFIGFYFAIDLLNQTASLFGGGGGRVAYMAHLAGYAYGFALAVLLLALGILKREEFDVFYLFRQARRRAAFRAATRTDVGGAWSSASADTGQQLHKQAAQRATEPISAAQLATSEARVAIQKLVADHRLDEAARRYRALLEASPEAVLTEPAQLDVANQLQADGDDETAALAYELLLRAHPRCVKTPEVRLILAAIYARRLDRPDRAAELLEAARQTLSDPSQKALAEQLLAEVRP